jgi:hypothetical protein
MNLIKRLDLFLLEKFPLIWHTKILYALIFSTLMSSLFYLWGYLFTNEYYINRFNSNNYFEKSNALLCLFILNAIFIIIWALAFYRKNAVKHLYPLQRFYFTKLLCSFLLIFWSLTWPVTSFNWGVRAKIHQLAPTQELSSQIQTINFSSAFLFDHDFSYQAYNNVYHPEIQQINFNYNDSSWSNMPSYLYMDSTLKGVSKDEPLYSAFNHPENNDTVQNKLVQFLVIKEIRDHKPCGRNESTAYFVEARKLKQLCPNELSDLRNFTKETFNPNYFKYPQYKNIFEEYAQKRNYYRSYYLEEAAENNLDMNKEFNVFLNSRKRSDFIELITKYEKFLIKHQIAYSFNKEQIIDYVLKRRLNMNFKPIVAESTIDLDLARADLSSYGNLENYESYRKESKNYLQPLYFVETNHLEYLYSNSVEAHNPAINWTWFVVSIYFALILAFLFFLFAIGNPINLIIAASVGGVFIILNILFFVLFLQPRYTSSILADFNFRLFTQLVVFCLLMYSLLYVFFANKGISKRLLLITFHLCFGITLFVPFITFQFLESILKKPYQNKCFYHLTEHSIFYYWAQDPIVIWLSAFGAILLFTHFIKSVLAKPE